MNKITKLFAALLILMITISSISFAAEVEPQEFYIDHLADGYNPSFTFTNVTDSKSGIIYYSESGYKYDATIKAETSSTMVCNFIFQTITIEKDGILYSDESGQSISAIVGEVNKVIVPDGEILPAYYDMGYTLTFNEIGEYVVTTEFSGYRMSLLVTITKKSGENLHSEVYAVPTSSKVLVDGTPVSFEAYNIGGNNYFKLRDIAQVVSGTEKQFEVLWDNDKKAINLISSKPYTGVKKEFFPGAQVIQKAILNTSAIYIDDAAVSMTAYTIKGNNYFRLKDLAQAFNIGVTWDGSTNTVGIDTSIDYTN